MKTLIFFILLASTLAAKADFTGPYAVTPPTNGVYLLTFSNPHVPFGGWFCDVGATFVEVDTTLAPQALGLNVRNANSPQGGFFSTTAVESGMVSFYYRITGTNYGGLYWFYRDANNDMHSSTTITNLVPTPTRASFPIIAGHQFGFHFGAGETFPPSTSTREVTITDFSVDPLPEASIFLTGTNSIVISWPSAAADWRLQVNTNLNTSNWTVVTIPSFDDGTNNEVVLPITAGNEFFRLLYP